MVAQFYLDENLPQGLVAALNAFGHQAVSTTELGRKRTPDYRQLLFAAQTKRILVTFDGDDFRLLHGAWREWSVAWGTSTAVARHAGILVLQQDKSGLDNEGMAQTINDLISSLSSPDDLANRLLTWTRTAGWREPV
jgi:hypothetical protein